MYCCFIQEFGYHGAIYRVHPNYKCFICTQYPTTFFTSYYVGIWFWLCEAYDPKWAVPIGMIINRNFNVRKASKEEKSELFDDMKGLIPSRMKWRYLQHDFFVFEYVENEEDDEKDWKLDKKVKKYLKKFNKLGFINMFKDSRGEPESISNFNYQCNNCKKIDCTKWMDVEKTLDDGTEVIQPYCMDCYDKLKKKKKENKKNQDKKDSESQDGNNDSKNDSESQDEGDGNNNESQEDDSESQDENGSESDIDVEMK